MRVKKKEACSHQGQLEKRTSEKWGLFQERFLQSLNQETFFSEKFSSNIAIWKDKLLGHVWGCGQTEGLFALQACHMKHLWNINYDDSSSLHTAKKDWSVHVCLCMRWLEAVVVVVRRVLFGVVLSLGICPKFTPAPHFPASVGVMREGESERHSRA